MNTKSGFLSPDVNRRREIIVLFGVNSLMSHRSQLSSLRGFIIGSMVLLFLSFPTSVKPQKEPTLEGISDTACLMDYKSMWFKHGCKRKVGYVCRA